MKKINWQYAFGEILIVIIGITIAFSMNRCAENQKDSTLKQTYLENLKSDIEADRQNLETNVTQLTDFAKVADEVVPHLNSDSDQKMRLINNIFKVSNAIEFHPQDVTFNTLINSGDLRLFKDFKLKTSIQRYYSYDIPQIKRAYDRQDNIHKEYLGDYYIHHANFDLMREGKFPFENEKLLKSIIQSLSASSKIQLKESEKGVSLCDSLISILNQKLKN